MPPVSTLKLQAIKTYYSTISHHTVCLIAFTISINLFFQFVVIVNIFLHSCDYAIDFRTYWRAGASQSSRVNELLFLCDMDGHC